MIFDKEISAMKSIFDLSRFILDEFRDDLTSESKHVIIEFVHFLGNRVVIPREILLHNQWCKLCVSIEVTVRECFEVL